MHAFICIVLLFIVHLLPGTFPRMSERIGEGHKSQRERWTSAEIRDKATALRKIPGIRINPKP